MEIINTSTSTASVSTEVFKANKNLLSKWKESNIDTNAELEERLKKLQEQRDQLLSDISENE